MKITRTVRLVLALIIVFFGVILFVITHANPSGSHVINIVVSYSGAIIAFLGVSWLRKIVKSKG
ncbi:hypothetical protein GCM10028819_02310 [Spirosoma humi]